VGLAVSFGKPIYSAPDPLLPAKVDETIPGSNSLKRDLVPFGDERFSGRLTYYGDSYNTGGRGDPPPIGPQNGGWYGACYSDFGIPKNWNKFAALNIEQYQKLGSKKVCGKCVQITNRERKTIVQIVDMCPSCRLGALDISHIAMAELVGSYEQATFQGIVKSANWTQVDCSLLNEEAFYRVHGTIT